MTRPKVPICLRVIPPTMDEVWKYSGESINANKYKHTLSDFCEMGMQYLGNFVGDFELNFLPNQRQRNKRPWPEARRISHRRFNKIIGDSTPHQVILADLVVPTDFSKIAELTVTDKALVELYTEQEKEKRFPAILYSSGDRLRRNEVRIVGARIGQSFQDNSIYLELDVSCSTGELANYRMYFPKRDNPQP